MPSLLKKSLHCLLFLFALSLSQPAALFAADLLYIVNNNDTVSVIDTVMDSVTATITLRSGSKPVALCLNPVTPRAYTLNSATNSLSVLDTEHNTVVSTVSNVERLTGISAIACDPTGTKVMIGNNDPSGTTSSILYLDTATLTLDKQETAVGANPGSIVFNKNGTKAFVLNQGVPSISVIDTSTKLVLTTTHLLDADAPYALAIHTEGTYLYVVNLTGNSVTFIHPDSMEIIPTSLPVGDFPNSLAVSSTTNTLYIAGFLDTITLVDPASQSVTSSFSSTFPNALIERNDGQRIYIASSSDDSIRSYATSTTGSDLKLIQLPAGSSPQALVSLQGIRHNFDLIATGNGSGSVKWPFDVSYPQSTSGAVNIPQGIEVTVHAIADSCSTVVWNGCDSVSGGGTPSAFCTVNPDSVAKTVNAEFSINFRNVTTTVASGNGIINCSTQVCDGGTSVCSISPATGYILTSLTDNGNNILGNVTGGSTFQVLNVVEAHEIIAGFTPIPVTLTPLVGTNGTIFPGTPQGVSYGNTARVTITPDAGYHTVTPVGGTCGGVLSGTSYTTAAIMADCTIEPAFALNSYTVTVSAGSGGLILPSAPQKTDHNSILHFTISPPDSMSTVSVGGCNGTWDPLNPNIFTTGPITSDCSISASFTPDSFAITSSSSFGGSVNGPTSVARNGSGSFTVTADSANGFHIDTVSGCGGTWNGINPYLTGVITSSCTVSATFALNSFTVTPSTTGTGGTISPNIPQSVSYNYKASFTLTPTTGYHIASVGGTCGGALNGTTYTTVPTTANCTVVPIFTPISYSVTPSTGLHGGIVPSDSQSVLHGASTSFTLVPEAGYSIVSVAGCNGTLSGNSYTTGVITGSCTISALFIAIPVINLPLTIDNGTVTCSKPAVSGDSINCIVTPDNGYHLSSLADNGVSVLTRIKNKNSYSLEAVTSSHSLTAAFAPYTLADALKALRIAVGIASPTPDEYVWLDVAPLETEKPKGDGVINIMDALVLLKQTLGTYSAW